MEICCMAQETQMGALYQSRGVGWARRWEGGSKGRGYTYTYGCFMLGFDRKQQNSLKQLSFNKKKKKKCCVGQDINVEASVLFLKEGRLALVMSACNFQWEKSKEAAKERVGGMGREVTQAGAGLLHLWYPLPPSPQPPLPFPTYD